MYLPSRGPRASATTTRQEGWAFLPIGVGRIFTASRSPLPVPSPTRQLQPRYRASAFGEGLHQLLSLCELPQQAVDVLRRRSRPAGDPTLAAPPHAPSLGALGRR